MTKQIRYELIAVGGLVIIGFGLLLFAVLQARMEVRDNLRKDDLANLKRGIEYYNNARGFYPVVNEGVCTHSNESGSNIFGTKSILTEKQYIDAIPHDVRESANHIYRYCATEQTDSQAQGYFLEAQLEENLPEQTGFDEDESRKFDYRILHENDKVLYRVCGGTETQCKSETE